VPIWRWLAGTFHVKLSQLGRLKKRKARYYLQMKFILDMGISPKVKAWLREVGHEALHIDDLNPRALDSEILKMAQDEGAVVLTSDKDFSELLALGNLLSPSVILFRLIPAPAHEVIRRLSAVLADHHLELEKGCMITIGLGKPRLRLLPLKS